LHRLQSLNKERKMKASKRKEATSKPRFRQGNLRYCISEEWKEKSSAKQAKKSTVRVGTRDGDQGGEKSKPRSGDQKAHWEPLLVVNLRQPNRL
jgi:hypothetical protein